MRIGSRVVAVQQIAEPGFGVHAETGDAGEVVHVEDGIPTVRFERTGTATIVDPSEVACQHAMVGACPFIPGVGICQDCDQDGLPIESI